MEIAISPTTIGLGPAALVDLCVAAEELGYRQAWLAEVAGPESFSLAGAIANATEEMDVGVAVVPAATRSPALMAMGAATVSGLLAGRTFSLGVGASSQMIVESWHDRDFAPPVTRVRESVLATRALLQGERDFEGETVSVRRFALATSPGEVRLLVGALGPRMLRLAGAVADGVCLNLMTPDAVPRQLAEIERGAAEAGRSLPEDFAVMARFHVVPGDDLDDARGLVRSAFGPYFAQPVYNRFLDWMGFGEEAVALAGAFAEGDRAGVAAALHDSLVDGISLVGPVDRIGESLEDFAAAGVDVAALSILAPHEEDVLQVLRGLGGSR